MSALMTTRRDPLAPWHGLRELEDRINRMFSHFPYEADGDSGWTPAVDLQENENEYLLEADLPGLSKEDIQLNVQEDIVTLKGERKHEEWKQDDNWRRIERSYGSFQRSFRLPAGVDGDKVEATFANGVLKVRLPKVESAKPRQIEVKIS